MKNARSYIIEVDRISKEQGFTQAEWSRQSGFDEFGKMISNTISRGDCKLSAFIQMIKPLGYEIMLKRTEE